MWNPWLTRDISSLIISESLGLSNPCVSRGCCSLIVSETLGALWDVESMVDP